MFKESKLLYQNFVPLDLKNLYEKIISCESGIGISINSEIQNIIKDTVSIFLNLSLIPSFGVEGGIPVLRDYTTNEGLDINFRDMEFHENEAVNYSVVSRVINQLFEMQRQVLNSIRKDILDPEDEEDFAGAIIVGDAEFEELNINAEEGSD